MAFVIDNAFCIACNVCREVCPNSAVRLVPEDVIYEYEIEPARCTECGGESQAPCINFCPVPNAIGVNNDA